MINYFIPLLEAYFDPNWIVWFLNPIFCIAFIATVPALVRQFFFWRS